MARSNTGARRGFTLVETMLVVVVASLIMAIGVPRFLGMRQGLKLDGAAYQLAGDLRRAQVEAIKRNQTVVLAKTDDSTYSITFLGNRKFESGVTFGGAAMTVSMASFGPPVGGGSAFAVTYAGRTKTVTVGANGLVSVQ
jgi:prepilin-type N-terminal cleavage/methylation domain-containing protein